MLLYVEGEEDNVGEVARRSIGIFDNSEKLLQFNDHIIHTNIFRLSSCVFDVSSVMISLRDQTFSTNI